MNDMQTNGHRNGTAKTADRKAGIRARCRQMRAMLQEGVEAALRADPDMLERCNPKTGAGRYVRALVLEAGKGKMTAMKTVLSLLDWEPDEDDFEASQAISDGTRWDWSADGVWETMPEAKATEEYVADDRWPDGPQAELKRRLERLLQGNEADQARAQAIIAQLRAEMEADAAAAAEP